MRPGWRAGQSPLVKSPLLQSFLGIFLKAWALAGFSHRNEMIGLTFEKGPSGGNVRERVGIIIGGELLEKEKNCCLS